MCLLSVLMTEPPPIIGKSFHKYLFVATKHASVATNTRLSRQNTSLVAKKRRKIVATSILLSRETRFCFVFLFFSVFFFFSSGVCGCVVGWLSLAGAATSTNTCLSRQTCVCDDKTRLLSRQKYVCRDNHVLFCRVKGFVATKDVLCRCRDKHMFTLVAAPASDRLPTTQPHIRTKRKKSRPYTTTHRKERKEEEEEEERAHFQTRQSKTKLSTVAETD